MLPDSDWQSLYRHALVVGFHNNRIVRLIRRNGQSMAGPIAPRPRQPEEPHLLRSRAWLHRLSRHLLCRRQHPALGSHLAYVLDDFRRLEVEL